jgi:hypothetical protein
MAEYGILITDRGEQAFEAPESIKKMTLEQVNKLREDIDPEARIIQLRPLTREEISRISWR